MQWVALGVLAWVLYLAGGADPAADLAIVATGGGTLAAVGLLARAVRAVRALLR